LFSVGIGGHISDEDHGLFSTGIGYEEGMRRELIEEVAVEQVHAPAVGLINDDSTDVGYVHFGVVHIMQVADESVAGGRSGIVSPEFISISKAMEDLASYESWSRFCLEHLDAMLGKIAGVPASAEATT
jgi:predicted NUDIX family phosphoesterase